MSCTLCGLNAHERAHVKPRRAFAPSEDDEAWNIIYLCPTHHTAFDNGRIGICPDRTRFIIEDESGVLQLIQADHPANHIIDEYVRYRNQLAKQNIKFRLGIFPMVQYGSWCDCSL